MPGLPGGCMLEVSPVRAFPDNYIWLIRAPGDPVGAAVVDPGDARPAEDALDREGLRLSALFEGTPAQIVGIARPACAAPGGTRLHRGHDTRSRQPALRPGCRAGQPGRGSHARGKP